MKRCRGFLSTVVVLSILLGLAPLAGAADDPVTGDRVEMQREMEGILREVDKMLDHAWNRLGQAATAAEKGHLDQAARFVEEYVTAIAELDSYLADLSTGRDTADGANAGRIGRLVLRHVRGTLERQAGVLAQILPRLEDEAKKEIAAQVKSYIEDAGDRPTLFRLIARAIREAIRPGVNWEERLAQAEERAAKAARVAAELEKKVAEFESRIDEITDPEQKAWAMKRLELMKMRAGIAAQVAEYSARVVELIKERVAAGQAGQPAGGGLTPGLEPVPGLEF